MSQSTPGEKSVSWRDFTADIRSNDGLPAHQRSGAAALAELRAAPQRGSARTGPGP
jgi:hypothetical protein